MIPLSRDTMISQGLKAAFFLALGGTAGRVLSQLIFRPAGARSFPAVHPRLAPWAAFCRRFAAIEGGRVSVLLSCMFLHEETRGRGRPRHTCHACHT